MKTMRKTLGLIVAMMLATSVWAQSGAVGTGRYDQQIQQDVTKVLQSKDKWKGITASTDDGIVTLNGSAKVLIDKLDVAKKADKIEHVQGVRDHVQVESNVPDEQLRQQLAPFFIPFDGFQIIMRRDDRQVRERPLSFLGFELLRASQFEQMTDRRRQHVAIALVIVVLLLETADRLGNVASDGRFLGDDQRFAHGLGQPGLSVE